MAIALQKHYKGPSTPTPFLIYKISTGQMFISSDLTTDSGINHVRTNIDNLSFIASSSELNVSLINISNENGVTEITEKPGVKLIKKPYEQDYLVRRGEPNDGDLSKFLLSELSNFAYEAERIKTFIANNKLFFKMLLRSTIKHKEVLGIINENYGDIQLFDVERYINENTDYDVYLKLSQDGKKLSFVTCLNIGPYFYSNEFPIEFVFKIKEKVSEYTFNSIKSYRIL